MARNKSYISLLNELWGVRRSRPEALSNEATMLYLCLLDIFNRGGSGNQWPGSVNVSDRELERLSRLERHKLSRYRAELIKEGFIRTKCNAKGRAATINYILYSRSADDTGQPEVTVNCGIIGNSAPKKNGRKRTQLKEEMGTNIPNKTTEMGTNIPIAEDAPKKNGRKRTQLKEEMGTNIPNNTLYILSDSINKTTTTIGHEEVVVVEPKKEISLEEIYRGFYARYFDQRRSAVIEQLCMNMHISRVEFENFAQACITEWLANGEEHKDPATGQFDEKNASRHLVNHIRVKVAAKRREQLEDAKRPKTKEEARRALIDNCLQSTNRVIQQEHQHLQEQARENGTTYIPTDIPDSDRPF